MGPFALRSEHAQDLGRVTAGAAEPVGQPGVELDDLTRAHHPVLAGEDQAHAARQDVQPDQPAADAPVRPGPPNKHTLALMIWLSVFPTLTVINLAFGDWLKVMSPVLRTFVLATIAVPIVIYGLMPQLHRLRVRLVHHASY